MYGPAMARSCLVCARAPAAVPTHVLVPVDKGVEAFVSGEDTRERTLVSQRNVIIAVRIIDGCLHPIPDRKARRWRRAAMLGQEAAKFITRLIARRRIDDL